MRFDKLTKDQGFTLVELLIVVIILAILAAIVVPQFAASTKDASDAALRSNLASVRSAIDLYRQQHQGGFPGAVTAVPTADCTSTTKGTGTAVDDANRALAFIDQLTMYTNAKGEACSKPEAGKYPYGPYLRSADLPANPVTDPAINDLTATAVGDLNMPADGPTGGWKYDTITGRFIANTNLTDSSSTSYDTY